MQSNAVRLKPFEKCRLKLPLNSESIKPAKEFLQSWVYDEIEAKDLLQVSAAADRLLRVFIELNLRDDNVEPFEISIQKKQGTLILKLKNKGVPIFPDDLALDQENCSFEYQNLGRNGQDFIIEVPLQNSTKEQEFTGSEKIRPSDDEIELRELRDGEEAELSKLFHRVYGYMYIHDYVYHPGILFNMRKDGKLKSHIATLKNGKIIAHVGLLKINSNPDVYEYGLGLTDPKIISSGLFRKVFHQCMEESNKVKMDYSLFEFVTNHDYSQKIVMRYDCQVLALNVGSQISETQAKLSKLGIGVDPTEMDRYSILLAIKQAVPYPFGKSIILPVSLGEKVDFLLEPLGIDWIPASRFSPLIAGGYYKKTLQPTQKAVQFDLIEPGSTSLKKMVLDWHNLLRDEYQHACVDIPLNTNGVGQCYDHLTSQGFFFAGFVPYRFGGQLALRMQSLAPRRVGFDHIKVRSNTGKELLELVMESYERNKLI